MMVGLARWCVRHRNLVIVGWVGLIVALGFAIGTAGTAFSDSTKLPSSDSATAYNLLGKAGSNAASGKSGTIVWTVPSGSAVTGEAGTDIAAMLTKVSKVDGVAKVVNPFNSAGNKQISADGRTAYATVVFSDDTHASQVETLAKQADSSVVDVQVGGQAFTNQIPSESTELIGVLAALVILLLVFRSMWAAALPIITGVAGVGVSTLVVMLLSHVISLPSVAISMGALIGLGVGIDYALFIVNRQRKVLRAGASTEEATITSLNTSGRAVLFAGGTVMIALLGMLVLNVGFLTGMAISASITVAITVLAAVTLLPALLGKLGRRVLRRSDRSAAPVEESIVEPLSGVAKPGLAARWAKLVQRRPVVSSLAALVVLIGLAAPALALRLGSADASSDPSGTSSRGYYNAMSSAFGDGFQSQLLLVAQTPDAPAKAAWVKLVDQLPDVKGVASVTKSAAVGSDGTLSMVTLTPTTTSQAKATSDLVTSLRSKVITEAESGTDLQVHVGGTTATAIDYADALTSKLPIFLGIIAGLGFLLLMIAFRSLLVPAIGALGNLLSIAVALGVTVAMFQWGWGPSVFGIGGGGPVEYIVAMLMVGVVFGLSMDYHVFLVSRMHEEWTHRRDNRRAVGVGVADTGKVIATAAAIMGVVFASFGFSGLRTTSEFGVGLAVAVLADAFLVRLTIVPAVMTLVGARNWALPGWLDRVLPHLSIEGADAPGDRSDNLSDDLADHPALDAPPAVSLPTGN
ncbi:putative drug exporter of the RND superfamily [Frankineae bacterium MT45]|nr:putative drug exporter of the RND superfamily [Frankineae bacterium MT45]